MRIHLLSVAQRVPAWVDEGYATYAGRMPHECRLELKELSPAKRARNADARRVREAEGQALIAAIPKGALVVALDEHGGTWSTRDLARRMDDWLAGGRDVALMIGGADGLSEECRKRADGVWSLSRMTFPHALVRVLVAEQLYRAWTVLNKHPYHRE
ncbi:MAG: 23S rRNA (pseudouridine(1915)-N(3))-methyltransferase RlmH [Gammaproteobacteria bacterium]